MDCTSRDTKGVITMTDRVLRLGLLFLMTGCSGTNLSTDGGTGADRANKDSTSDQSKVDLCESISTEYETALLKAEECTLGASHQCTQTGIASFFCQCHTVVNGDTANLAAISGRFDAAGCTHGCIGICIDETSATCKPDSTSSTGGRCLRVQ
jgi:hypothetical protein